jgi:hypothetical protein
VDSSSAKRLAPEKRQQILDDLDRYFARIDAKRQPVSEEEAGAIINEALRSARPDYFPFTPAVPTPAAP